jgi:PIN domain nuclease of toxin-antitoxin system
MRNYVADTHALLWALSAPEKLGRQASRAFAARGSGSTIHISVVSLWEVALLHERGRVGLPAGFSAWREAISGLEGLRVEPLLVEDVEEARGLGGLVDPFDRLITGVAVRLGAWLISRDERLRRSRWVRTVW